MTTAQLQVISVLVGIAVGISGVWYAALTQARARRDAIERTAQARAKELTDARTAAYTEGAADARREMQPRLDLARSERDAAIRRAEDCERQNLALEAEIRRIMRGGNGK